MFRLDHLVCKLTKLIVCALFLVCPRVWAQLSDFLPPDLQDRVINEEVISSVHGDDMRLELIPRYAALNEMIEKLVSELNPSIMVESICWYKKPASRQKLWNIDEKTKLFNGILSLSTLEGLRYYSVSRKKTRLLYEISHVVDSPEAKNKLPDPLFTVRNLPAHLVLYAKQKDLTFGENIYKFDFWVRNDGILFQQTNLTPISYGIIPVLGKEKLRSIVTVLDLREGILIYTISMADALSFLGMKNRVGVSFASRSEAILSWFREKANAVYN
ncbi:MAG: hypothetical protein LBD22_06180 [Spirochaetaceae bacterium]|nr:hypothetical protein [Spirochaetaceae bacterium]